MSFGENITALRKNKGITQEQLAAELGVTRQTISKWELDQSTPDLNYIRQLSDVFGVTTDYLIKGEEVNMGKPDEPKTDDEKTIVYVERNEETSHGGINSRGIVGIIVAVLGGIFILAGVVNTSANIDNLSLMLLGVIFIVIGVELIMIKKHPVLKICWTIWVLVLAPSGFVIQVRAGVLINVSLIYLVILIVATVMVIRAKRRDER